MEIDEDLDEDLDEDNELEDLDDMNDEDLDDMDLEDIDDDLSDMDFDGDESSDEEKSSLKRKASKSKGNPAKKSKSLDDKVFVSAEEFAEMLENHGRSKFKHGGSRAMSDKDGASAKQLDWEVGRNERLSGFRGSKGKNFKKKSHSRVSKARAPGKKTKKSR